MIAVVRKGCNTDTAVYPVHEGSLGESSLGLVVFLDVKTSQVTAFFDLIQRVFALRFGSPGEGVGAVQVGVKVPTSGEGVLLVMQDIVHQVRELSVVACGKAAHIDVVIKIAAVGFLPVQGIAVGVPVTEVSSAVVDVGVVRVAGYVPAVQLVHSGIVESVGNPGVSHRADVGVAHQHDIGDTPRLQRVLDEVLYHLLIINTLNGKICGHVDV